VSNRSTARSGVVLLGAGVAALAATVLLARQRSAADAGARQQTVETSRAIEDRVGALKTELGQELDLAADIPQLRSALANRADPLTFTDLFQHEEWWTRIVAASPPSS
jgi:hypothetical protein